MILGVDIGGTRIKVGILHQEILEDFKVFERPNSPSELGEFLRSWVGPRWRDIRGVGIGIAGLVHREKVIHAPNLPPEWWIGRDQWEKILGKPVRMDNDVNAILLGEAHWGVARDIQNAVLIAIGTGVGGGVLWNGRVVQGSDGFAGEVGHMPLVAEVGRRCRCGNTGCVEAYIGGWAIEAWIQTQVSQNRLPRDVQTPEDLAKLDHPQADAFWDRYGRWVGYTVVALVHLLDPERVILTGGVSGAWDRFAPSMKDTLATTVLAWNERKGFQVVQGVLGDRGGVWGAAALWLDSKR